MYTVYAHRKLRFSTCQLTKLLPRRSTMSDLLTLVFQPDNPCNTTIIDEETGKVMYQVATEHGKSTITRVKNAVGDSIASWEWRDVRSDIITLGNGTPTSVSTWLKKSLVPFKGTVTFQDASGRNFKWKGNGPGMQFELYIESDKTSPIAQFRKSRRIVDQVANAGKKPATLTVNNIGEEILDLVVISFLVLEKARRGTETSTLNRAEGAAFGGFSAGV